MNIDERSNEIFIDLIDNPQITSNFLCEKFNLTRGQLNYTLKKINDYLQSENLTEIRRTKNGYFVVNQDVQSTFKNKRKNSFEGSKDFIFSNTGRLTLIKLMLLSREDYLSLNHFIDDLKVSKNTILRDMKDVKSDISRYGLNLKYSRQKGYYIEGEEWDKRILLADLLIILEQMYHGNGAIIRFANLEVEKVEQLRQQLRNIEGSLSVEYVEDRFEVLPMLLILILRRIKKGKFIEYNFEINYEELRDTKEYLAIEKIFDNIVSLSENERIYITLLLLTTNLSKADILSASELTKMRNALIEFIDLFENITGVIIKNKDILLDRLIVHMRPAYYRIKYNLNLQTSFYKENKDSSINSLFSMVKNSITPMSNYFGQEIPEVEIFFISLFIGSHIFDDKEQIKRADRKKAIVVCPNALSMSVLLESSLGKLFPELFFEKSMSTREFYSGNFDADYIFSAVPLDTDKQVYIVNNFLSVAEKKQLRERVLKSTIMSQNSSSITPEKILEVIKKHVDVKDELLLYNDLLDLYSPEIKKHLEIKKLQLVDVLNANTIQIIENDSNWQSILNKLARPLEDKNLITSNYIATIKNDMPTLSPYIVFKNSIALPHTESEAGALGVGLSLGIIKEGVKYDDNIVHTVILLASDNKEEHVELLFEIMELADSEILREIEKAESVEDIQKYLNEFNKEYWRK